MEYYLNHFYNRGVHQVVHCFFMVLTTNIRFVKQKYYLYS
jgi:hypothetical protein